jgi:hypothetical protein
MSDDCCDDYPLLSQHNFSKAVQGCWPKCSDILRDTMDQMQEKLVKAGENTDTASHLVLVMMLHEIFFIQTADGFDRGNNEIICWIEEEYEEWTWILDHATDMKKGKMKINWEE